MSKEAESGSSADFSGAVAVPLSIKYDSRSSSIYITAFDLDSDRCECHQLSF